MNQHKTGDAFPNPRAPGDPRTLREIGNRTPWIAGGAGEIHHIPGRTILTPDRRKKTKGSNRHYNVKLLTSGTEGAPIYKVTVTEGWVSETLPGPNDALAYHEADNHREEVDPATDPVTYTDVLRKFTLTVGQAVYVDVKILPTGQVGGVSPSVTIAIDDDNESSAHYRPRVDDETSSGAAGNMRYKLAVLEAAVAPSTTPTLKEYLAGGDITYIPELPAILSTMAAADGIGILPKEWSESDVAYKFRALSKALGQLNITTNGNVVEVRGNKTNTDLEIYIGNVLQTPTIGFEDGLITTGNTVIGDEDPAVASMQLKIEIPTVTSDDASVTITDNGGANGPIYDLSVDASDALPSGSRGDMLYHNGTDWAVLTNPGDAGTDKQWVMHHQGVADDPEWVKYDEITVNVCISGTPTGYKILGIATA